mgnify:CR=1 FL=1
MKSIPGDSAAGPNRLRLLQVIILPAFSGGLLALAVTPHPSAGLALVCLVPMFLGRPCRFPAALIRGLVLGTVYYLGTVSWTLNVQGFEIWHLLPVVFYLSFFYAFWALGLEMSRTESAFLQAAVLASLWVVLEYVRNNFGFLALPWAGIAHGFLDVAPIRQFAALFGEYGLAFLAVAVNVSIGRAVSDLVRGQPCAVDTKAVFASLGFAIAVVGFGYFRLAGPESAETLRVRLVQEGGARTKQREANSIGTLESLTRSKAEQTAGPDLVVWPEGAVKLINRFPFVYGEIFQLSKALGAPIVFGASSGSKYLRRNNNQVAGEMINEMVVIDGAQDGLQKYGKRKLVPFGEYIPLSGSMDWPDWLVPSIIEVTVPPGPPTRLLISGGNIAIAPAICWENLFSANIRTVVPVGAAVGANISNLSIFDSPKAVVQHNSSTVLRAIENGIAFILATDTGPSWLVTPTGEVVARTAYGRPQFAEGVVPVSSQRPLYWRIGDVLVLGCALLLMAWAARRAWQHSDSDKQRDSERNTTSDDSLAP